MKYGAIIVLASGCAVLGPMPATTGVSAIPAQAPELAMQTGAMPGYYLSASATEEPNGEPIQQLLAAFDPGEHVPGLVVAGRVFTESGGTVLEPVLGYRKTLGPDQRYAVAAFLYGTRMGRTFEHATYAATRAGLEGAADVRLTEPHPWFSVHAFGSLSVTNVSADGTYCVTTGGYATDCEDPYPEPPPPRLFAEVSGVYPAVTAGVAIELGRHRGSIFHAARFQLLAGGGAMPTVVRSEQEGATSYLTIGLAITLAFGAR